MVFIIHHVVLWEGTFEFILEGTGELVFELGKSSRAIFQIPLSVLGKGLLQSLPRLGKVAGSVGMWRDERLQ